MSDNLAMALVIIVIAVCLTTCMVFVPPANSAQIECIKARGSWDNWNGECKFK